MTIVPYLLTLMPVSIIGAAFLPLGHMHGGILFGTSVPVEFPSSATGRRILRGYRWRGVAALLLLLVMDVVAVQRGRIGFNLLAVPVEVAIWFALYFIAVHRTRPFAIQPPLVRTASLAPDVPVIAMLAGYAATVAPLLAAAVYLHLHWQQIPGSFPVHWNIQGQADGWSHRTVANVYRPIWTGAAVLGVLCASAFSTRYARGSEALRKLVRVILLVTSCFVSFAFAWVALLPLIDSTTRLRSMMPPAAIASVVVNACIILAIVVWSMRAQTRQRGVGEPYDGTPDAYWYAGMFYANPNDPAILVPKRFGIGYTLNFGRPVSWVFFAILLLPLGLLLLYKHVR